MADNKKDVIYGTVGDILLDISSGFACSKEFQANPKKGISHLRPNNIGYWGNVDLSHIVYIAKEKNEKNKFGLKEGDILFNNTNSKELVGRAVHVNKPLDCAFSNHITRLRINTDIMEPKWLVWYLYKLWLEGYFLHICKKWIGQAGVDSKMLKRITVTYPKNVKEQKQIADKIDCLFSGIDKGAEKIWLALESAKALLQSELSIIGSMKGSEWGKFKLKELVVSRKFAIVDGPFGTQLQTRDYKQSGVALIRIKNIRDNLLFDDNELTYISEEKCQELKRSIILPNDIILAKTGATIGKVCLFPNTYDKGLITSSCAKITVDADRANIKYILYMLHGKDTLTNILRISTGATRNSLTLDQIENLEINTPIKDNKPNIAEQSKVVERLDKIEGQVRQLEEKYREQLGDFNMLKQSILNQAFQGKL